MISRCDVFSDTKNMAGELFNLFVFWRQALHSMTLTNRLFYDVYFQQQKVYSLTLPTQVATPGPLPHPREYWPRTSPEKVSS